MKNSSLKLSLFSRLLTTRRTAVLSRNAARSGGFTLVEVTLAIGIVSFAFVAMFGLLPVGLSVSKEAIDTTIEAQIVQQLKTQALQTDFSRLGELPGGDAYYFDDQGNNVEQKDALYKAAYSVATSTSLPASGNTGKLATVTIHVLKTRGIPAKAAANPASESDAKKFTLLIPDNGL